MIVGFFDEEEVIALACDLLLPDNRGIHYYCACSCHCQGRAEDNSWRKTRRAVMKFPTGLNWIRTTLSSEL